MARGSVNPYTRASNLSSPPPQERPSFKVSLESDLSDSGDSGDSGFETSDVDDDVSIFTVFSSVYY